MSPTVSQRLPSPAWSPQKHVFSRQPTPGKTLRFQSKESIECDHAYLFILSSAFSRLVGYNSSSVMLLNKCDYFKADCSAATPTVTQGPSNAVCSEYGPGNSSHSMIVSLKACCICIWPLNHHSNGPELQMIWVTVESLNQENPQHSLANTVSSTVIGKSVCMREISDEAVAYCNPECAQLFHVKLFGRESLNRKVQFQPQAILTEHPLPCFLCTHCLVLQSSWTPPYLALVDMEPIN